MRLLKHASSRFWPTILGAVTLLTPAAASAATLPGPVALAITGNGDAGSFDVGGDLYVQAQAGTSYQSLNITAVSSTIAITNQGNALDAWPYPQLVTLTPTAPQPSTSVNGDALLSLSGSWTSVSLRASGAIRYWGVIQTSNYVDLSAGSSNSAGTLTVTSGSSGSITLTSGGSSQPLTVATVPLGASDGSLALTSSGGNGTVAITSAGINTINLSGGSLVVSSLTTVPLPASLPLFLSGLWILRRRAG